MMTRMFVSAFVAHFLLRVNALPQNQSRQVPAQALYLMDNHDQNSIHAIRIKPDGTLSKEVTVTPTGGEGASGFAGGTEPLLFSGPDAFYGTGSIRVSGNLLFSVNTWSNTLSMFHIDPRNPLHLEPAGAPVDTQGYFPNSVAISPRHNLACVTNIGAVSGISCFRIAPSGGLAPISPFFAFDLGQTTPPVGFANIPPNPQNGRLFLSTSFNADESALIVTQSGNPTSNVTGHLLIFPVDSVTSTLKAPVLSTPEKTTVIFNTLLVPNSDKVFVTDPTLGTAIIDIDPTTYVATTNSTTTIPGQLALCWSFLSPVSGTVYGTDNLVNRLVEQDLDTGDIVSFYNGTAEALGMSDLYGSGNKLYALSQGDGTKPNTTFVTVFDVSAGRGKAKIVQNLYLDGFAQKPTRGSFAAAKGMWVWPDVSAPGKQ